MTKTVAWHQPQAGVPVPTQYNTCFYDALRRMAIVLNQNKEPIQLSWLRKSNEEIEEIFDSKKLNSALVQFTVDTRQTDDPEKIAPDDDQAENDFYSRFDFRSVGSPKILRVGFSSTEAFHRWSYEGLAIPSEKEKGIHVGLPKRAEFARDCAANYLLKNFWHNFVHKNSQFITESNYHKFRGIARFESDFAADNLGTIFLAHSYGFPVRTAGRISPDNAATIEALLKRNRSNRVFAERASRREEKLTPIQAFEELEWRFRRRVANALSLQLLMAGSSVADLGVYFNGQIHKRPEEPRRTEFYRDGTVVVRLNGAYLATHPAPYIEDPDGAGLTETRRNRIRQETNDRASRIVTEAVNWYKDRISNEVGLKNYAADSMKAIGQRFGMAL